MDLPTELSIFEILRRDIIAASELLGSAVGATSPHQMLMVRMCPLSPPTSHHHRIQMRPLMHLEHRKPANAALDDLLVVIVCVSSSTGDDVGGGGCHGQNSSVELAAQLDVPRKAPRDFVHAMVKV